MEVVQLISAKYNEKGETDLKNNPNDDSRYVTFSIEGELFEYDPEKNRSSIRKHGVSFEIAARVVL